MVADHAQAKIFTPKRNGTQSYLEVDAGIADLILDVWDIDTTSGFCRTYASCEGDPIDGERGYLMFQAGYFEEVRSVVECYGHYVEEHTFVDNCVWPAGVWECIRWIPTGS